MACPSWRSVWVQLHYIRKEKQRQTMPLKAQSSGLQRSLSNVVSFPTYPNYWVAMHPLLESISSSLVASVHICQSVAFLPYAQQRLDQPHCLQLSRTQIVCRHLHQLTCTALRTQAWISSFLETQNFVLDLNTTASELITKQMLFHQLLFLSFIHSFIHWICIQQLPQAVVADLCATQKSKPCLYLVGLPY